MNRWRIRMVVVGVLANLAVTGSFWFSSSGHLLTEPWTGGLPAVAFGRLAGLLLQFALLLQLILIGRVSFIERELGFDRLNRLHRLLGYSLMVLLFAHPLLLSIGYGALNTESMPDAFSRLVFGFDEVLSALVGALLLLAVIALSVPWVRHKLRYESWHAVHLVTYLAIWLAFEHQLESGGDFANRTFFAYWYLLNGVVVALFFGYRFLRPFILWYRHRFVVESVVRESSDTWSVYIGGRGMERFRFEPGQYANIHLLARGLWSGHPFSFSREYDGVRIRFTIKAMGDATYLIEHLTPGTHVVIDGPLGVFTPRRAVTDKYLLIAGGVGVTPLRAIAGELAARNADREMLYAARSKAHTSLLDELRRLIPRLHLFMSQEEAAMPPDATSGRIDGQAIQRFVPDVMQRDVFICGPTQLMDDVTQALRAIGVPSRQIHTERFGF